MRESLEINIMELTLKWQLLEWRQLTLKWQLLGMKSEKYLKN